MLWLTVNESHLNLMEELRRTVQQCCSPDGPERRYNARPLDESNTFAIARELPNVTSARYSTPLLGISLPSSKGSIWLNSEGPIHRRQC